jgi:hypothetical protein
MKRATRNVSTRKKKRGRLTRPPRLSVNKRLTSSLVLLRSNMT